MSKKIHIVLVLDKSSSMADTKAHTISGFNEQVAQIKLDAKDAPHEYTATLITFNGQVYEHLLAVPLDQLQEADPEFYRCEGSTALWDGMGYAIRKLKEIAGPADDVLINTISDGHENSSTHYTADALREEIEGLKRAGRWTFAYMGCTAKNLERVGRSTGIPTSNMAVWNNTTAGGSKRAMVGGAAAIGRYMKSKSVEPDKVLVECLYTDQPDQFMDFAGSADGRPLNLSDAVASEAVADATPDLWVGGPTAGGSPDLSAAWVGGPAAGGSPDLSAAWVGGPAAGGSRHRMMRTVGVAPTAPRATHAVAPVQDRPEDLQLRVGTSDVFGWGNRASW